MAEKELGDRIASRRLELGLKQSELAKTANISRTYLSFIENGKAKNVSTEIFKKLAYALNFSISSLISNLEEPINSDIDPALRKFALQKDLNFKTVQILSNFEFSGNRPSNSEEWEKLYLSLKDLLENYNS